MSAEIQAEPDLRVNYRTRIHEDGGGREQSEVEMLDDGEQQDDNGSQNPETTKPRDTPAVNKIHFTVFKVFLGVMYLLFLAGVILRATLKISELKSHISQLQAQDFEINNRYENLKNKTGAMELNSSQLQSRYDILSKNHSQLMDEVKKLKSEIKDKCCPDGWTTFGASCYFKFTGRKTWTESREDCQGRGADLVIINSKEEQEFISELGKNSWFWIGLKRTERGWEWWDGTSPTGTFWAHGEQHRYNGYNVVCCDDHGKWAVSYSAYTSNWICEKLICRF